MVVTVSMLMHLVLAEQVCYAAELLLLQSKQKLATANIYNTML